MSAQRYTVIGPGTFTGAAGLPELSSVGWRLGEVVKSDGDADDEGDVWAWRPDESRGSGGYIALSSLTMGDVEIREAVKVDDLKTGDRVRVTFEGRIDADGDPDLPAGGYVERGLLDSAVSLTRVPRPVPEWQRGDVVVDTAPSGLTRTLLRGRQWHGSDGALLDDETVSALFRSGAARHTLRNGKEVSA